MDYLTLFLVILILFPLIYFFYFWANSDLLEETEIKQLAISQRFCDIFNYLGFTELQFEINKEFKSALNKNGQLYNCDELLNNFPSTASALLKGKKHEWVIFAFVKNKKVYSFYTNKGNDNQSVSLNMSYEYVCKIAKDREADVVLEFHNHPNAVLASSQQDISSANYYGKLFVGDKINFLAFVSGRGRYYQYGWWFTDSLYNVNNYLEKIQKENGTSRSVNFALRKELKRKKYFKDLKLNSNSSHNFNT